MSRINGALGESLAAVSFISLSLQEQRAASEQVACNVERVAQSVEENAAAQGGIVRTTQELKAMSDGLGAILQRFSLYFHANVQPLKSRQLLGADHRRGKLEHRARRLPPPDFFRASAPQLKWQGSTGPA
ncbi:UNVERIFIED_ORG: hypothetical protein J2Y76_001852 [Pseudomonas reinekei]|uniref:hypothetical protein n=1 Tax=Pseudomonas laurylsulfatiphila TaxID=2011015 RepID=UPI003D24CCFF|nr:hypothetical protein [Pseudomonas reinekei]